jgi:opacity protein-like surface antigen
LKHLGVATALLVVALAAGTARADDEGYGRSGVYVGVGASRMLNLIEDVLEDEPILSQIQFDDTWGVNGRVGYRVTSWFAVEAEYEWLDKLDVTLGPLHSSLGTQTATANFKLIGPFGRFQPYFLGGIGAVWFDLNRGLLPLTIDSHGLAGRVGLGMDFYVTRNLLLNVGAEGVLTDTKADLGPYHASGLAFVNIQAGLGFRF